jgi:alcohol dehydrogenase class IV
LEFVITFIRALNLPLTLKELEINQDAAELIAIKAVEDPSCKTDPRPLTQQELQQIFLNAYSGKELSIYYD